MRKIIMGLIGASVISLLVIQSSIAQNVRLQSNYPDQHTVVRGDTLWDISNRFLRDPWLWPEIWYVNPQIENPHLIYPGDIIRLVYIDGQPRLTVDRSNRVIKLSPKVRVIDSDQAIATIPLEKINNFLSKSRIVGEGELEAAPYIISVETERILGGKTDKVYARGEFDDSIGGYGIYRRGQLYKDPESGELLGVEAIDVGSASMRALDGEVATLYLTRSVQEIRIQDRLLVEELRAVDSTFFPSSPENDIDGEIIAVQGGVTQVGRYDVVVINKGTREGLEVGNVLALYKRGGEIRDRIRGDTVTLPDERAGLMMVFRTFEKLSLGLVLESDQPLSVKDKVSNP